MSRIRANQITNKTATGAPTVQNGLVVTGVSTATTFSGSGASLTSLPAGNLTGALPAISGANLTGVGGGITEIDCWRVNSTFQGGANPITSNWERFDTQGEDKLGTGMTQSSGVFSFPSTGYWKIMFHSNFYSGSDYNTCIVYLKVSTNGGAGYTYNTDGYGDLYYNSGNGYQSAEATQILKVTNISNFKITLAVSTPSNSSVYWIGGSGQNMTYAIFEKLAEV